jgi:hypothetical protein
MGTLDELLGGSGQVGRLQGFPRRYEQGARAHGVNLGGVLANPAARVALGGIAAMAARQVQQHR